jgi:hypothetical protein
VTEQEIRFEMLKNVWKHNWTYAKALRNLKMYKEFVFDGNLYELEDYVEEKAIEAKAIEERLNPTPKPVPNDAVLQAAIEEGPWKFVHPHRVVAPHNSLDEHSRDWVTPTYGDEV